MAGIVAPKLLPRAVHGAPASVRRKRVAYTHAIAQTRANGTNRRTTERAVIEKNQLLNESAPTSSSSGVTLSCLPERRSPLPGLSTFGPPKFPPSPPPVRPRQRSAGRGRERYREQHLREGIPCSGVSTAAATTDPTERTSRWRASARCDDARLTQEELNDRPRLVGLSPVEKSSTSTNSYEVLIDGPERHTASAVSDEEFHTPLVTDTSAKQIPEHKEHGGPHGTLFLLILQAREGTYAIASYNTTVVLDEDGLAGAPRP